MIIDFIKEVGMALVWLFLGYLVGERSAGKDNKDAAPTLDENGDLFEPVYKCKIKAIPKNDVLYTCLKRLKNNIKDLQEIKKFFEFVRENKENLFEMAGFKGALE